MPALHVAEVHQSLCTFDLSLSDDMFSSYALLLAAGSPEVFITVAAEVADLVDTAKPALNRLTVRLTAFCDIKYMNIGVD